MNLPMFGSGMRRPSTRRYTGHSLTSASTPMSQRLGGRVLTPASKESRVLMRLTRHRVRETGHTASRNLAIGSPTDAFAIPGSEPQAGRRMDARRTVPVRCQTDLRELG